MSMPLTKATTYRPQPCLPRMPLNVDSVFRGSTSAYTLSLPADRSGEDQATASGLRIQRLCLGRQTAKTIRRHGIELQRSSHCRLPVWCFFFIGAPLRSDHPQVVWEIPLVISVFLFIFYYIIDNTGNKMAREGVWRCGRDMAQRRCAAASGRIFHLLRRSTTRRCSTATRTPTSFQASARPRVVRSVARRGDHGGGR